MRLHYALPSTVLALLVTFTPFINACQPPLSARADSPFQLGNDGPADAETLGYSLNHMALLVNNLTESLHFYTKIIGMRHVFSFRPLPSFSITYLSHSHGGLNGTGHQTGDALFAQKGNTQGQLELIYAGGDNGFPAGTKRPNTFSHVGLTVPDTRAVQKRMQAFGVRILKKVGEKGFGDMPISPLERAAANAFGLGDDFATARKALAALGTLGFNEFLIVEDPDGNMLEIQPAVV